MHHPVFRGKPINYDPRERFIARYLEEHGDYNIFHAFYRELVQALYDTGASPYVFCVNVDAVIAALLLALVWREFRTGILTAKDLETAAFNVFLYGRMIGAAAEIDRPSQSRPQHGHAHAAGTLPLHRLNRTGSAGELLQIDGKLCSEKHRACDRDIAHADGGHWPMTHPRTLQELLLHLRGYGSTPAIIATGRDDASTRSFAELFDASQQFAKAIAARDLEGGHTIGLMAPNSPAWIEAFFGIVTAGGIVMPIDVQTSDEDLQRMLAIGECRLVFAGAGQIDRLRNFTPSCAALDLDAIRAMPQPEPPDAVPDILLPPTGPNDVAVLAFTSGTTGMPKAVPLSHANLMSNVEALVVEGIIGPHDRALVPLPFHHAYPLTVGILTVLASGATIVLPAGISGPQLVEAIREGQATALLGVPRLYDALLANIRAEVARRSWPVRRLFPLLLAASSLIHRQSGIPAGRWAFRSLHARIGPTLRLMVSGGAALSAEVETTLIGLGWRVLTGYGLTETSPILAFNRPGRSRIGAAGQALPGVQLRIANPDAEGCRRDRSLGAVRSSPDIATTTPRPETPSPQMAGSAPVTSAASMPAGICSSWRGPRKRSSCRTGRKSIRNPSKKPMRRIP